LEKHQLIQQTVFIPAQGVDPVPDRRHALADIEVEPLDKRGIAGPATCR
jgi:hypothetical protein